LRRYNKMFFILELVKEAAAAGAAGVGAGAKGGKAGAKGGGKGGMGGSGLPWPKLKACSYKKR